MNEFSKHKIRFKHLYLQLYKPSESPNQKRKNTQNVLN